MSKEKLIYESIVDGSQFERDDASHVVATIANNAIVMPINPDDEDGGNYKIVWNNGEQEEIIPVEQIIYGTTWHTVAHKVDNKDGLRIRTNKEGGYTEIRFTNAYYTPGEYNKFQIYYSGNSYIPTNDTNKTCIVRFDENHACMVTLKDGEFSLEKLGGE